MLSKSFMEKMVAFSMLVKWSLYRNTMGSLKMHIAQGLKKEIINNSYMSKDRKMQLHATHQ
jgi:hypothetical protein